MKPRVLMVGRMRYALPLEPSLRRKFDALQQRFELRVLGSGLGDDDTFSLYPPGPLDGLGYHASLPFRVARELRSRRTDAILVQGPHEASLALLGRALARSRAQLIVDVHGDWRTATRLYGSRARRLLDPLADRLAAWALRRADKVRTVSDYTTGLVRELGLEPAATFPAYVDLEPFLAPPVPLPERPTALPSTGLPRSSASTMTRPIPSDREGRTSSDASSSARATSSRASRSSQRVCSGRSRTSASTRSRRVPRPTIRSDAPGSRGATSRQAAASPSTFL